MNKETKNKMMSRIMITHQMNKIINCKMTNKMTNNQTV